jgi:cytoskeletal protein CcmA (bactofilin family)
MQGLGGGTDAWAAGDEAGRPLAGTAPKPPPQAWIEERTRVAVSRNINVSGRLVFQEPVRIEGHFRGDIGSTELVVISEGGFVEGRVRSPRLLILGELQGEAVSAKSVILGPRARFTGTIETEKLTVCEGAYLECDARVVGPGESGGPPANT